MNRPLSPLTLAGLVSLYSPDAAKWMRAYSDVAPTRQASLALGQLRAGCLKDGFNTLQGYHHILNEDHLLTDCQRLLAMRHYHSIMAYYFYQIDDFSRALDSLDKAEDLIQRLLLANSELVLMAKSREELLVHRARVYQRQCSWSNVRTVVARLRAVVIGEEPYYTLSAQRIVTAELLTAILNRVAENLPESERQQIYSYCDRSVQENWLAAFTKRIYLVPTFIISDLLIWSPVGTRQ